MTGPAPRVPSCLSLLHGTLYLQSLIISSHITSGVETPGHNMRLNAFTWVVVSLFLLSAVCRAQTYDFSLLPSCAVSTVELLEEASQTDSSVSKTV
jgi:hypothetical protein